MAPSSSPTVVVVALMVMAVAVLTAQAQTQTAACASKLIPCAEYLNATTRPPNTCCDPIKEAVDKDLACLCNLYKNPAILTQFRINITEALRLPSLCGIPNDVSACKAEAPSGSKSPPGSNPGSGESGNDVGKIGSSVVVGLFLISAACFMLF